MCITSDLTLYGECGRGFRVSVGVRNCNLSFSESDTSSRTDGALIGGLLLLEARSNGAGLGHMPFVAPQSTSYGHRHRDGELCCLVDAFVDFQTVPYDWRGKNKPVLWITPPYLPMACLSRVFFPLPFRAIGYPRVGHLRQFMILVTRLPEIPSLFTYHAPPFWESCLACMNRCRPVHLST
jgi:hypothetical protein